MNAISYMWPDFGADWSTPGAVREIANGQRCQYTVRMVDQVQAWYKVAAANYSGYGAIMMFNLRESGQTSIMNNFAFQDLGRQDRTSYDDYLCEELLRYQDVPCEWIEDWKW